MRAYLQSKERPQPFRASAFQQQAARVIAKIILPHRQFVEGTKNQVVVALCKESAVSPSLFWQRQSRRILRNQRLPPLLLLLLLFLPLSCFLRKQRFCLPLSCFLRKQRFLLPLSCFLRKQRFRRCLFSLKSSFFAPLRPLRGTSKTTIFARTLIFASHGTSNNRHPRND